MKQKPSMQFYVQDFLGSLDVQMMSAEEVGVYCLLLFNCFNNGGVLPSNIEALTRICRGIQPSMLVLGKFYEEGEFLHNERIDFEIKKIKNFSKKMSAAANNRWKSGDAKALPTHMPKQCSSTSTSTSTSKKIPPNPHAGAVREFLDGFNALTGSKFCETPKVLKALNARFSEGATLEQILLAARAAAADDYLMGRHENNKTKKYLTPEYILRPDKFQQWLNSTPVRKPKIGELDYYN